MKKVNPNEFGDLLLEKTKTSSLQDFFIVLASKSKPAKNNPFLNLETKIFKSPRKNQPFTIITLEKALNELKEAGKKLDLSGVNDEGNTFDPQLLLSVLDNKMKNLSCTMDENFLIVDFKSIKNIYNNPLGTKAFRILKYSDEENEKDMIRRSED